MTNYTKSMNSFIWNFRLDVDPVGIKYVFDETIIETRPVSRRTKAPIFCQYLAATRSAKQSLFMAPEKFLCKNPRPVFYFRELDKKIIKNT